MRRLDETLGWFDGLQIYGCERQWIYQETAQKNIIQEKKQKKGNNIMNVGVFEVECAEESARSSDAKGGKSLYN